MFRYKTIVDNKLVMDKNTPRTYFLLLLLVMIIAGGIYWFNYRYDLCSKYRNNINYRDPVNNPIVCLTDYIFSLFNTNQNLYKSEKYGFEFNYPVDFTLTKINDNRVSILKNGAVTPINIIFENSTESIDQWLRDQKTINTYLGTVGNITNISEKSFKFKVSNEITEIPGIAFNKNGINLAILGNNDEVINEIATTIVFK